MNVNQVKINQNTTEALIVIGRKIRAHRKSLKITAIAAAEAADISRVTLHRIEHGEPTVTIGAYVNVMRALNLVLDVQDVDAKVETPATNIPAGTIPVRIHIKSYPQLMRLAWHVHGVDYLTPKEALGIYERNWRHMDTAVLEPAEQELIEGLRLVFTKDVEHV
jgi:transcriptional regulator with XRE-family HTH domain